MAEITPKYIRKRFDDCTNAFIEARDKGGDAVSAFNSNWMGTVKAWQERKKVPKKGSKVKALRDFFEKRAKDSGRFAFGYRTNLTESFHNMANHFARKGLKQTFEHYKLLKNLTVLFWNAKVDGKHV